MSTDYQHDIRLGDWAALGAAAQAIRFDVFVQEQNVPADMELDDMDAISLHAIACDVSGTPVGTARLLPDNHIGRMAVKKLARGMGIGSALLHALMAHARERGDEGVALSAQTQAEPFYARHGFVRDGAEFLDAGILHVRMKLAFS